MRALMFRGAVFCGVAMALQLATPSGRRQPDGVASLPCSASESVCAFLREYISAFNARDFTAFTNTFAEDVSVFFDAPLSPERRDGKAAVEAVFRPGFSYFHPSDGRSAPPLPPPLIPSDLHVQEYGDVAVVSFLAQSTDDVARRTLVLRRGESGGWHVVHIHASSAPKAKKQG